MHAQREFPRQQPSLVTSAEMLALQNQTFCTDEGILTIRNLRFLTDGETLSRLKTVRPYTDAEIFTIQKHVQAPS